MWCKWFITHIILAAAYGLWHRGSLFYHDIHCSQRGWYITNLLLYDIPWNKAPCTGPCHIWRTVCSFFGHEKKTDSRAVGWFRWPVFLMATSAEAFCCSSSSPPPPPQNNLLTSPAFIPDSESVSATRISLMASSCSFIYFFLAIARDPQSSALFRLLCMTWHSFRNVIPVSMNVFYSDSKTDLKLQCGCCIKIPAIRGYPWCCY